MTVETPERDRTDVKPDDLSKKGVDGFAKVDADIRDVRSDMAAGFARLDTKIDAKIDRLDDKFDRKIDRLDEKFDKKFDRLGSKIDRWTIGLVAAAAFSFLSKFFS